MPTDFQIPLEDGLALRCTRFPANQSPSALIIIAHGYSFRPALRLSLSNWENAETLPIAGQLRYIGPPRPRRARMIKKRSHSSTILST